MVRVAVERSDACSLNWQIAAKRLYSASGILGGWRGCRREVGWFPVPSRLDREIARAKEE